MYNVNLELEHTKTNGRIWRKTVNSGEDKSSLENRRLTHNGFLLRVNSNPTSEHSRFSHAAFDSSSNQIAATDHLGKLFLFELTANRYRFISRLRSQSAAIIWNYHKSGKILTSLTNCDLCYIDIASNAVTKLVAHKSPAAHLGIHSKENLALSNSSRETILWNLDTLSPKQKLDIKQDVELIQALFAGDDRLITCFKDNSIFIWNINTLQCIHHLKPLNSHDYRTFAVSRNGCSLVTAGMLSEINIWDLESCTVVKVVKLPSVIKGVKKIFLLDEFSSFIELCVIALVSSDGFLYLIDVTTSKILYRISGHNAQVKFCAISPSSELAVIISEFGCLDLYDLKILAAKNFANERKLTNRKQSVKVPANSVALRPYRLKAGMDPEESETVEVSLDVEKLKLLLENYGEYPEKYRILIWKFLLQLPENRNSFCVLEKKGIHYSFEKLQEKFPLKDDKILEKFKIILSCLAFWSPVFGQVDYIPLFCFPFVKTIPKRIECFEIIAVILMNWCQNWFEFYPSLPVTIIGQVESLIKHHDKKLTEHFTKHNVTPETYAWPLLQTAFSESFSKTDWLQLWDNIFSNHPSFIICVVAAYNIVSRQSLMTCTKIEDFQFYFNHQNPIDLSLVLKEAYKIQQGTPDDISPKLVMFDFQPLATGTYPVFNKYPRHVINHQASERQRIQKQEQEYQLLKQSVDDLDKKLKKMDMEEKMWQQKLENFKEMEKRRKRILEKEEQQHVEQRNRLLALKRELQLKELCLLKTLRSKFSKEQQLHWQMQIQELEQKIQTRIKEHDNEIISAMADVKEFQTVLSREKQNFELEIENHLHQTTKENQERLSAAGAEPQLNLDIRTEINKRHEAGLKNIQTQYKNLIAADQEEITNVFKNKCKTMTEEEDKKLKTFMTEVEELNEKTNELEEEIIDLSERLIEKKLKAPSVCLMPSYELKSFYSSENESSGDKELSPPKEYPDTLTKAFNVRQKLARNMSLRYQN